MSPFFVAKINCAIQKAKQRGILLIPLWNPSVAYGKYMIPKQSANVLDFIIEGMSSYNGRDYSAAVRLHVVEDIQIINYFIYGMNVKGIRDATLYCGDRTPEREAAFNFGLEVAKRALF